MSLSVEKILGIYDSMCRVRAYEDRLSLTHKLGKVAGGVYTGKGHELLTATAASFLNKEDILGPTHRNMAAHFAKGITYLEMTRQWLAKGTGASFGKDNAAHIGDQEHNVFPMISPLATMMSLVAGAVLVNRIRNENRVALTFVGDGATSVSEYHEALALMAALKLPVVVVIENNGFAFSTANNLQHSRKNFADHAKAFAIENTVIDGTDVEQTYKALDKAFEHVRQNKGPYIVEGKVFRMSGHSLADNCDYVPESFKDEGEQKVPLARTLKWLTEHDIDESQCDTMLTSWQLKAADVFKQVLNEPDPKPETVLENVYASEFTI
jgi:TPP-dependent pyruvate/acetoin dehydrogenase alpha subunit